jgi:hypothetical protein
MTPFEQVEAAWRICDSIREYGVKEGREISTQEALDKFILVSPDVDIERTRREAKGNATTRVYLKSPYGIEYREATKAWVPFRHGEVKL